MLEIDSELLVTLKCDMCNCYLSCAPVMLKQNGGSICGRCPSPEKQATRNKPYEQLASIMAFPCRYKPEGCTRKMKFHNIKQHEDSCKYHPVKCPVAENCDWIGPHHKVLQHCQVKHPDQVLQHPCILEHDITKDNFHSYIMTVFNVLFLIQTKVCVTTAKIYHSVRLIGDSERACKYKYQLDIEKQNGGLLRKEKIVVPDDNIVMSDVEIVMQDSSICVLMNNCSEFLGGFEGVTFKITVNKLLEPVTCALCEISVGKPAYKDEDGWLCSVCAPAQVPCEEENCKYRDIEQVILKHMYFYCTEIKECYICDTEISVSLEEHYKTTHSDIFKEYGGTWPSTLYDTWQWYIAESNIGTIFCAYRLTDTEFSIEVISPLKSSDLSLYTCEVRLSNPKTDHFLQREVEIKYGEGENNDNASDWTLDIGAEEIEHVLVGAQCDISIEIW